MTATTAAPVLPAAPPAPERPPSIELRDVRKAFAGLTAVDGVSLAVAPGEFLTLLGPSGCGKTTTLRMIGGFELPTGGEVWIEGEAMGDRPPYQRPVNTVFQNYALFPHLSVGQNVAYGLEMAGVPKRERTRRVAETLELVHLPDVAGRRPAELSGGQQQRVALARALVNRPAVLLLDEPLGALDLQLRKAMQGELKRLNREVGATFVYVTHDQDEALAMSDRIAVMDRGRILQVGTPEEIYERPRGRFVAGFIGAANLLAVTTRAAGDEAEVIVQLPAGEALRAHLPAAVAAPDPGTATTLAVRPEKIVLAADLGAIPAGWNVVEGIVAEVKYLGAHRAYVLTLAGGESLVVHRANQGTSEPSIQTGERLRVCFDPAAATLLTD